MLSVPLPANLGVIVSLGKLFNISSQPFRVTHIIDFIFKKINDQIIFEIDFSLFLVKINLNN